jgi:hypothetical protein
VAALLKIHGGLSPSPISVIKILGFAHAQTGVVLNNYADNVDEVKTTRFIPYRRDRQGMDR